MAEVLFLVGAVVLGFSLGITWERTQNHPLPLVKRRPERDALDVWRDRG